MATTFDFLAIPRRTAPRRPVDDRLADNLPVELPLLAPEVTVQARRCMDCGVPFCQSGCPLGNPIPDFNEAVRDGRWEEAFAILSRTNNFPEFTGRICPAPCEQACVLRLIEEPVTIEQIERTIGERAFEEGWIQPITGVPPTGKRVAVIGSGPAGLAAAAQLATVGHDVTVFERDDRPGGLLRYGVPDFKLAKDVVERRIDVMRASGIAFECGVEVGRDVTYDELREAHDAVVIATGATRAHDLPVPGRDLGGVHTAWDYLTSHAKCVAGDCEAPEISAAGKRVLVIGGGDTASDCIGVAHRQGAASVVSFQITERPPERVPRGSAWPFRSPALSTSSSHEEGGDRIWSVSAQEFLGDGRVERVRTLDATVDLSAGFHVEEIEGTDRFWDADLVVIAIGYAGPETDALTAQTGVGLDGRGRVQATQYATAEDGVFVAGDAQRGASLVVWAISEGREAARAVDVYLRGESPLPTKGDGDLPRA
jgi:glutamate synthase (NADPH/NADH) small chain